MHDAPTLLPSTLLPSTPLTSTVSTGITFVLATRVADAEGFPRVPSLLASLV